MMWRLCVETRTTRDVDPEPGERRARRPARRRRAVAIPEPLFERRETLFINSPTRASGRYELTRAADAEAAYAAYWREVELIDAASESEISTSLLVMSDDRWVRALVQRLRNRFVRNSYRWILTLSGRRAASWLSSVRSRECSIRKALRVTRASTRLNSRSYPKNRGICENLGYESLNETRIEIPSRWGQVRNLEEFETRVQAAPVYARGARWNRSESLFALCARAGSGRLWRRL